MKIRCSRCGNYIDETAERCPSCGAFNENMKRTGMSVPTTIDELKAWYVAHNLPDEETTRFFIGKNCQSPKAFGIYKDEFSGDIIVYKNKADGSRAVRYQGRDEAYAVNELYLKLKEEMNLQKARNMTEPSKSHVSHRTSYESSKTTKGFIFFIIFIVVIAIGTLIYVQSKSPLNKNSDIVYEANDADISREVAATQSTTQNNSNESINDSNDAWLWMLFNSDTSSYSNSSSSSSDYSDSWSSSDYSNSWSSSDYFDSWSSSDYSDSWSSSDYSDSWSSSDYSDSWSSSDWDTSWDSSDSWNSDYSDWSSDW